MERGKPLKRATQTYGRGTCHAEIERTTRLILGTPKISRQMIIEGWLNGQLEQNMAYRKLDDRGWGVKLQPF